MKRESFGEPYGDDTWNYKIYDYNAKTVGDFVQEVLSQYTDEFGSCVIWGHFEYGFLKYRFGKIVNPFTDENVNSLEINYVSANGGWSEMTYYIHAK